MAFALIAFAAVFGVLLLAVRAIQADRSDYFSVSTAGFAPAATPEGAGIALPQGQQRRSADADFPTPTPDSPHPLPPVRTSEDSYTMQPNDTLGDIARRYGVSLKQLIDANAASVPNPDIVPVGTVLLIPVPRPDAPASSYKVIPDSELVYGPASATFNVEAFIRSSGGFLSQYYENIDDVSYNSAGIVQRVAQDYSVNPRLLLAVLEYQSGWVTRPSQPAGGTDYPLGWQDSRRKGLYRQLAWAANNLNRGFYVWRVNGAANWVLNDSAIVPIDPTINAGTAAVQNLFAALDDLPTWQKAVGPDGLVATYIQLFGSPFDLAVEPLLPGDLAQPALELPFEPGKLWAFTGGPHGGWDTGSAWAAVDFAPPGEALGCVQNDDWVVASADGTVVRTGNGAVVQDLDVGGVPNDGVEQTGWTLLYMHVETRDRVAVGTHLKAGDRIGHPSCEGGVSSGTHLHLARRYNGEWIPADQSLPFDLGGWISSGDGYEYNGFLTRGNSSIEAYAGRSEANGIQR